MSDTAVKWVYWISTGLVALVYLGAAAFYISMYDMVKGMYEGVLHYPTYIIWPLAILKFAGSVVILWRPTAMVTDWAYGAMFWHLLLAASAHMAVGDPGWPPAVVTWMLLIASWWTANRVRKVKSAYAPGGQVPTA
jgi:hypothetical protein